ncbi:MAG: methionine synthase, partial [Hyphomicrobiaceae bacterium]|nr:methionine synthase [Hyphomicrobiaceae bacterium]
AVGVVSNLLSEGESKGFVASLKTDYAKVREAHIAGEARKQRITLAQARANAFKIAWNNFKPVKPTFMGPRAFNNYDLAKLVPYIDWTPFFQTWELSGRYPQILADNKVGAEAKKLFDDAQALLTRMIAEKWVTASGVVGFWPANSVGDDIEVYSGEPRKYKVATLHTLRQQIARDPTRNRAHTALADFVAPKETGLADYIGGFAVTAGLGEEEAIEKHIAKTDDYTRIMAKALCDRLAEAFAEAMHEKVRKELWGYAKDENLTNEDLILEKYSGIRPAPGYPAQPDHTEKKTLWALMDVANTTGIALTESFAMWPGASVSGLYFAHPDSHYFGVGKIERDQIEDYAQRKKWTPEEAERWLAPVLNYDPRRRADTKVA